MQSIFENLINGNLTDAKKKAKRYSLSRLCTFAILLGYSPTKALAASAYLKGNGSFQRYCDAT
jgi:hypothetical protein